MSLSAALLAIACGGLVIRAQEPPPAASAPAQDLSDQLAPEKKAGADAKSDDVAESEQRPEGESAAPPKAQPPAENPTTVPAKVVVDIPDLDLAGLPPAPAPKYLVGTNVVVSWSEKGDAVWGFSKSIGKWTKQEIQPAAEEELVPLVSSSVAAVQIGHAIYAYSGQTGRWDILRLPADREPRVSVDADMVLVSDEEGVYTFANSTGQWSSPDATAPETPDAGKSSDELTMFYLKHAEAQSVAAILNQLFGGFSIVVEQRLNAIIVCGDSQEDLAKLEAMAKQLDQPQPDRAQNPTPEDFLRALRQDAGANAHPQPAVLRENYNQLEQRAARLAEQHRDLRLKATRTPGDAEALKGQLTDVVNEAFEARQRLQRAELSQLRQRLAGIEQQIATRDRIKDEIVDRRVEELLRPELRWKDDQSTPVRSATIPKGRPSKRTADRSDPLNHASRMSALEGILGEGDTAGRLTGPLLLFFHADWCQPSQNVKPIIQELRREGLSIVDVDMTSRKEVSRAFHVDRIPTLILCVDGVEVGREVGLGIEPLIAKYRAESSKVKTQAKTSAAGGAAVTQNQSAQAVTQVGDYATADSVRDVQIAFEGLVGARVTCKPDGAAESVIRLPGRISVLSDRTVHFRLSDIPAHAGLDLSGTIELTPISPQTQAYLDLNAVPIQIHNEDVEQATSGNLVTKAIYVPKPEHQEQALAGIESVVSTRLDPGVDPIVEADRRGHILAILRLGNRVPVDPVSHSRSSRRGGDQGDSPASGTAAGREAIADSTDAVVWIEAIIEEPLADSERKTEAVYMNGTVVSPDGLIAVVLGPREAQEEEFGGFSTANISFGDGRATRKARLVTYRPEYGVGLLKVDATDLPFLAPTSDPIAANQRLTICAMGGYDQPGNGYFVWKATVFQADHRIGNKGGFFAIVSSGPALGDHAGAALVSTSGHLQGILGRNTTTPVAVPTSPDGPAPDPTAPKLWAIPAHVIARLIEKYLADSPESKPQPEAADSALESIRRLETELKMLLEKYARQHPKVKEIETQLKDLRAMEDRIGAASPTTGSATSLILRSAEEFGRKLNEAEAELQRVMQLEEKG